MITNMVRKDVLRTDRQHKFYSGEDNQNINVLYNILTTFALHHPSVGYCQVILFVLFFLLFVDSEPWLRRFKEQVFRQCYLLNFRIFCHYSYFLS